MLGEADSGGKKVLKPKETLTPGAGESAGGQGGCFGGCRCRHIRCLCAQGVHPVRGARWGLRPKGFGSFSSCTPGHSLCKPRILVPVSSKSLAP